VRAAPASRSSSSDPPPRAMRAICAALGAAHMRKVAGSPHGDRRTDRTPIAASSSTNARDAADRAASARADRPGIRRQSRRAADRSFETDPDDATMERQGGKSASIQLRYNTGSAVVRTFAARTHQPTCSRTWRDWQTDCEEPRQAVEIPVLDHRNTLFGTRVFRTCRERCRPSNFVCPVKRCSRVECQFDFGLTACHPQHMLRE
jgi:hypothetical protein